jgi:transforming growth factor-beta-induced protein
MNLAIAGGVMALGLAGIGGVSAVSGVGVGGGQVMGVAAQLANAAGISVLAGAPDIVDTAVAAGKFNTLAKALTAAELVDALKGPGPFTVFAPTDEAFAALGDRGAALLNPENKGRLTDILKFHVVPGIITAADLVNSTQVVTLDGQRLIPRINNGRLEINQSVIRTADIKCGNGIIHVIDAVLVPAKSSIVEVAASDHSFSTLVTAVKAAGLVETLSGAGPFTVFAPTDDAFKALPAGVLGALVRPENKEVLKQILLYHAVPARVYARDAVRAGVASTAGGGQVMIGYADGRLRVNQSNIIKVDLDASNGVIHVIDRVLIPEGLDVGSLLAERAPAAANISTMNTGTDPRSVLNLAIERGVPLFNDGNVEACAAIYEVAVASVIPGMNGKSRMDLESVLSTARAERNPTERAWMLRRGMDAAMESMSR